MKKNVSWLTKLFQKKWPLLAIGFQLLCSQKPAKAIQFDVFFDRNPSVSVSSPSPYNPSYNVGGGYVRFDGSGSDGDYQLSSLSNLVFEFNVAMNPGSPTGFTTLNQSNFFQNSQDLSIRIFNGGKSALFVGSPIPYIAGQPAAWVMSNPMYGTDPNASREVQLNPSLAVYNNQNGPRTSSSWIGFEPGYFANRYSSSAFSSLDTGAGFWDAQVGSYAMVVHNDSQPVPAPLPILGTAVAFGYSRKLRQRIKLNSSVKSNRIS